jgi:hypothetical protein
MRAPAPSIVDKWPRRMRPLGAHRRYAVPSICIQVSVLAVRTYVRTRPLTPVVRLMGGKEECGGGSEGG